MGSRPDIAELVGETRLIEMAVVANLPSGEDEVVEVKGSELVRFVHPRKLHTRKKVPELDEDELKVDERDGARLRVTRNAGMLGALGLSSSVVFPDGGPGTLHRTDTRWVFLREADPKSHLSMRDEGVGALEAKRWQREGWLEGVSIPMARVGVAKRGTNALLLRVKEKGSLWRFLIQGEGVGLL